MPPLGPPELSQPPPVVACEGVKQILWSPASAAVNVNFPSDRAFCPTTRWSLSNTSSTDMKMLRSGFLENPLMAASYCSALKLPGQNCQLRYT